MKLPVNFRIAAALALMALFAATAESCASKCELVSLQEKALQGDAKAEYRYGRLYENGWGRPVNYDEAAKWYRKSADQRYPKAQNSMGDLCARGLGVAQNYALAANWYRKAAEQGDAAAQTNLGNLYLQGQGVTPDDSAAAAWFWQAAKLGNATAQAKLGNLYLTGRGVTQNYAEAYFWLTLAEKSNSDEQKDSSWLNERDDAARFLTPLEISAVQKRVSGWTHQKPTET